MHETAWSGAVWAYSDLKSCYRAMRILAATEFPAEMPAKISESTDCAVQKNLKYRTIGRMQ
jgi:hypothetical protein